MLLKTHNHSPSSTFQKQLSYIKQGKRTSSTFTKNEEYYKVMVSVLDLLLGAYPVITSQLLILKQSLKKWYEYIQEQYHRKNVELLEMRENLVVYVSKEMGIVIEEIGYYVKCLTEHYQDSDMKRFYAAYLTACKKLDWSNYPPDKSVRTKNQEMQTDTEENALSHVEPTLKNAKSNEGKLKSQQTIDSPSNKFQNVDIDKYIKIKEENLTLERQIDQMASKISDLQAENKALKREIDRLFDENEEFRRQKEKSLNQIDKLKRLMEDLKNQEEERKRFEEEKLSSFTLAEHKYEHIDSIKNALHQELQNAENEILRKEELSASKQAEQYLQSNFIVTTKPNEQTYKTVKKEGKPSEHDVNSELRMMLLQAIAIESFINNQSIDDF